MKSKTMEKTIELAAPSDGFWLRASIALPTRWGYSIIVGVRLT